MDGAPDCIPEPLQVAIWGTTDAAERGLRHYVRAGCVVCAAARRADTHQSPAVRAAAGAFCGLVHCLARSGLPAADCAAAAAAFWGKQRNTPVPAPERCRYVLAHMHHCLSNAWLLRLSLAEFAAQAAAMVAWVGRHAMGHRPPDDKEVARGVATIADSAAAAILHYRCFDPAAVVALPALHGVPDVPVARWCALCHAPGGAELCARYAAAMASGQRGRLPELAEGLAAGVSEDELAALGGTRADIARAVLRHYLLHDASPLALLHKLNAAVGTLAIAARRRAVALEGGTIVPNFAANAQVRSARAALARLHRTVALVPGTDLFGGMPVTGLRCVAAP